MTESGELFPPHKNELAVAAAYMRSEVPHLLRNGRLHQLPSLQTGASFHLPEKKTGYSWVALPVSTRSRPTS